MHPKLRKAIVDECLRYEAGGDCYPMPDFGKETLVFCIVELWRLVKLKETAALRDLASAVNKLAPDLGQQISERYAKAVADENAALADILAVLRAPDPGPKLREFDPCGKLP